MGCGCSQNVALKQSSQLGSGTDLAAEDKKLIDSLNGKPPNEQLDILVAAKQYIDNPCHFLHQFVLQCRAAISEEKLDDAQNAIDILIMELDHEEQKIFGAFTSFDRGKDHVLSDHELEFMLDYLGYPCTSDDVNQFLSKSDSNKDNSLNFAEFVNCVGRLGGCVKLFEMRRQQIKDRTVTSTRSEHDQKQLQLLYRACGISHEAVVRWETVVGGSEFDALADLSCCQQEALRHVRVLAQMNHQKALRKLIQRGSRLGFRENDVFMALAWIRELSPIIVHIDMEKLAPHLLKDTHYRNQFETGTSQGLLMLDVRTEWEGTLFAHAYDKAVAFERPKYAVQNVWNDYRGVVGCNQYGDSYIVLKDVRLRCTLTPEDSGNLPAKKLAVLDYYAHVFQEYSDKELSEVLAISAGGAEKLGDSARVLEKWGKYKEAQIHGPICLDRHVDRLVVNDRHRTSEKCVQQIEEIAGKHGWKWNWMADMKGELEKISKAPEKRKESWDKALETLDATCEAPKE